MLYFSNDGLSVSEMIGNYDDYQHDAIAIERPAHLMSVPIDRLRIKNGAVIEKPPQEDNQNIEQKINNQYAAIDAHIIAMIKTLEYDNLAEVALAAIEGVFRVEALRVNGWVYECWDVQEQIKREKITFETIDDAIAALPPFDIR